MAYNNLKSFSEPLLDSATLLFGQMTVIGGMVLLAGFVLKIWQGGMGDVNAMIRAFITMGVIALIIPSLPGWVDQLQYQMHLMIGVEGFNADPGDTHKRFAAHLLGAETVSTDFSVWDLFKSDKVSIGEILLYGLIYLASMAAFGITHVIYLGQQVLLVFFVALSPVFLSFFLLGSTSAVAVKYFLRLTSTIIWPLGFAVCNLATDSFLQYLASDGLVGINGPGEAVESSLYLFGTFVTALWIIASTIILPIVITKVFMEGASAGGVLLNGFGNALTQSVSFGVGAGVTTRLLGGSRLATGVSGLLGAGSGLVSGATGRSGALIPAAIGIGAAMPGNSNSNTNWSERARELRNRSK